MTRLCRPARLRRWVVDVLHEQDEVQGVGGGGLELGDEEAVELGGGVVLSVDEQAAAPDVRAEVGGSGDDVLEQGDGLGVAACAFAQACGGGVAGDAGHGPRVVGDHAARFGGGHDQHLGGAGGVAWRA